MHLKTNNPEVSETVRLKKRNLLMGCRRTIGGVGFLVSCLLSVGVSTKTAQSAEIQADISVRMAMALEKKDVNFFEKLSEEMLMTDGKIPDRYKPAEMTKAEFDKRRAEADSSGELSKEYKSKKYEQFDRFCEEVSDIGYEIYLARLDGMKPRDLKIKLTRDYILKNDKGIISIMAKMVYETVDEFYTDKNKDMIEKISEIYPLTSSPQGVLKVIKIPIYAHCAEEMKDTIVDDIDEYLSEKPKAEKKDEKKDETKKETKTK